MYNQRVEAHCYRKREKDSFNGKLRVIKARISGSWTPKEMEALLQALRNVPHLEISQRPKNRWSILNFER